MRRLPDLVATEGYRVSGHTLPNTQTEESSMKKKIGYSAETEDWNEILLMTPAQLARAWEISPRKLWAMTASGDIPHVKFGRSVRYPVDDLRRWVDERKKGGTE